MTSYHMGLPFLKPSMAPVAPLSIQDLSQPGLQTPATHLISLTLSSSLREYNGLDDNSEIYSSFYAELPLRSGITQDF